MTVPLVKQFFGSACKLGSIKGSSYCWESAGGGHPVLSKNVSS